MTNDRMTRIDNIHVMYLESDGLSVGSFNIHDVSYLNILEKLEMSISMTVKDSRSIYSG